jgi:carboxypeptidase Taq
MPPGGVSFRGRQVSYLAGLIHRQLTDPFIGELLQRAEDSELVDDPHGITGTNLRVWRWQYDRLSRIPRELVEELAEVTTVSQQVWSEAREQDRFIDFLPWLERVLALKQTEADYLADGGDRYDALLEEYEPRAKAAELNALFEQLQSRLQPLLARAAPEPPAEWESFAGQAFPLDAQRRLSSLLAAYVGFDLDHGRIDTAAHPFFSPIGPGDCRITTHYSETDFRDGLFCLLHEIGHGLYEQGIDPEWHGSPLGESSSLGLHESQSRLWENGVGRSAAFWTGFYPRLLEHFPAALADVSEQQFVRSLNRFDPGPIRVRANRATYDLHILIRFQLERAMICGDLPPRELPGAWHALYHRYLGLAADNDADGCLQDGHWAAGQFGYFPTYTLGNVYAAQLLQAARRDLPDLDRDFAGGDFRPLRGWLHTNLYTQGQRYSARELVARATGGPPTVDPLVDALRETLAGETDR